jgi:multisubunit Na+/H+ antiporter MnhC subunit
MASRKSASPTLISYAIIIVCLLVAGFLFTFGVAHLIHPEESGPNVSRTSSLVGIVISLTLCGMGATLLTIVAAELRRWFAPRREDEYRAADDDG